MKTKYIFFTALLSLTIISCSDFLDKEPHSLTIETYFNDESELQSFLTGVYSPIMQEYFYGNYYPLYNAGGDDLTFYQRSTSSPSIMCANANSSNNYLTTYWRVLYDGISRANILLENADKNSSISESARNQAKAEALFLRSFYYFNLVQGWGNVPFRLTSAQSVNGLALPRTDKQIIYDRIISDITDAIPFLPQSNSLTYTGRATQSAARGILARIYLFRAGEHFRDKQTAGPEVQTYFEEAKKWALQVKESNIHNLVSPYSRIFMDLSEDKYNSTGVLESIWEAEESGNRTTTEQAAGRLGNAVGFGSTNDYSATPAYADLTGMGNPGYSYKFAYASLKLYEMYDSEGDTARGNWSITPYEYVYASGGAKQVTGRQYFYGKMPQGLVIPGYTCTELSQSASDGNKTRCAAKYRREHEVVVPKNKNYTPINFPILRYSDVLLMIAEADNELTASPSQLAYDCINAVRTRAGIGELYGLNKEQFRDAIKKERAMELCFEGSRRWDLIRWGDFYKNMTEMVNYVQKAGWNANYAYAANYYKVSEYYNYFPIPEAEMAINPYITVNNPGW